MSEASFQTGLRDLFSQAEQDLQDSAHDESHLNSSLAEPLLESLELTTERYIDAELLAEGGMKKIYQTYDAMTGREVAMARLKVSRSKREDPFLREGQLTALLDHPNIINVHDLGIDDEGPYFTMTLKKGDSLQDIIDRLQQGDQATLDRYPQRVLLEIFLKICDAVSYAHSRGVIHRDIKPANIQIGDYGEVLVCDWGLAKMLDAPETDRQEQSLFHPDWLNDMSLSGKVQGTPGYMAPEQVSGEGQEDQRCDIFGLGCLLYTMLCHQTPFKGSATEMMEQTTKGSILPLRDRNPQLFIDKGLEAVVLKATQLHMSDRYPKVAQLHQEIHDHLSGFSTQAENASFWRECAMFYQRNRSISRLGLGSLLFILVLTAGFIWKLSESLIRSKVETRRVQGLLASSQKARFVGEGYSSHLDDPLTNILREIHELEKTPPETRRYHRIAMHYIYLQRFDEAAEAIQRNTSAGPSRLQLATRLKQYAKKTQGPNGLLSVRDLSQFILSPNLNFRKHLEIIYAYDRLKRGDFSNYEIFIHRFLQVWNQQLDAKGFIYDPISRHLILNDPKISEIAPRVMTGARQCFLAPLKLKSLDLRGSSFHDTQQLKGLNHLESIDLRNTLVTDLSPLLQLPSLKEVRLSPQQFLPEHLKGIEHLVNMEMSPERD
jgi:serine/threonine-protein kinase